MGRPFKILQRDSVFLLIYLMQYLWIYSIIIPNLQGNTSQISPVYREILRQQNAFSF